MAENAGSIYYDIEMDVQGLLTAQQRVNQRLDLMERGFDGTTRAVNNTERSMSSLSGAAVALTAALSVKQVADYADAWATVNNKLSNSLRPNEQLVDVTQRVFDITQQTRGSLDATASLYARLERATRQYGTSAADLSKLTTIINQGFVVSGATAQEAENAIIQLSQGLASGALRGEEFNSVNEQGNRLIVALADSMGVSIGQMRNMAAQGKLTTDVVVNGLLSQGAVIGKEFANTTTTISQALQVAGNNVTKFFGENSTVKTGAAIFNDAVVSASENIGVLSAALTVAAGVMGSRYLGALTMSAAAQVQSALASQRQAAASNQAAQSALVAANSVQRKAVADKEAALSALALAQAEYNVAKGSAAEMLAMDALVAAKTRASVASLSLVQAENAQAVASTRAAVAARAASVGMGLARSALSLIGGPAGAAMLAAAAIFYFWQKAEQAKEEALRFADSLDKVNASMKAMNNTQLSGTIADANKSIRAQKDEISDLQGEVEALSSRYSNFTPEVQAVAESLGQGADFARQQSEVADQLAQKTRDLSNAQDKLSRTQDTAAEATRTLTNNMLTSMGVHDGLIQKGWSLEQVQGAVAKAFGNTADEINRANQAGQNFNPKALQVSPPTADGDKVILNLEEQNELLKIQDERQRSVTKARMQAAKVTDNPNQISKAGSLAGENYDLQKAEEARREAQRKGEKQDKSSAATSDTVSSALSRQSAAIARLNTGYADGTLELAKYDAAKALGSRATQQQIAEAERNAEAEWKLLKAKEAVAKSEKDKQSAQSNFKNLRGQASPVSGVDNQFQLQMEQLNQYAILYPQKIAEAEAVRASIETQYRQQRLVAMWDEWAQQNAATQATSAAFDGLASSASNAFTGIITGSMSSAEALRSIGNTILNDVINTFVQMGVQQAKSAIMGATAQNAAIATTTAAQVGGLATTTAASTASAGTTMAAWLPAALVASVGSFGAAAIIGGAALVGAFALSKTLAGGRKNGGPVSAGSMYQVGEGGMPEIYKASNGSQYMIPGDNGSVISNKDLRGSGGGGALQVTNNVYNYASGVQVDTRSTQNGSELLIETFVTDLQSGGPMSSEMESTFGLRRQASGAY
ncbi:MULTISPECIES: tape measure protein [Raoultella]|uniref:tape measure protein n=1 Tax=Raoultella TaxID=160674 RepID=UPI002169A0D2|nr:MULTISPECIES: tape measure protein [Raoultella]MCS4273508.1 tape measure domain-containing protein [Raoultella sp. BIGb0132]MCS4290137.1 tape measure domain-containing protein [Raoultella terrigena]